MMKNCLSVIFCASSLFAAGCGAEGMSTDEFETIEQELSSTADCDTTSPDMSVSGDFDPSFVSPSTYTHGSACSRAHLVNVTNYAENLHNHYGNGMRVSVTQPTSKSECERHRIGVYAWELLSNGQTSYKGAKWRWGSWESDTFCDQNGCVTHHSCSLPSVHLASDIGLTEGRKYRFASSARRYSNPKNSSSSFSLRKIAYNNIRKPH